MEVQELDTLQGEKLSGPLLLKPKVFKDDRGFFFESWNQLAWQKLMKDYGQCVTSFVQDNHSCSKQGVLRGMHYQLPPQPQGKLVRCLAGKIFDVAVDLRANSPTKGMWVGAHLSSKNHHQLWIPVGFAHGFLTLSSTAEVHYKTTDFWNRDCERSVSWDDSQLSIDWPECGKEIQLSAKDNMAPSLSELDTIDLFL